MGICGNNFENIFQNLRFGLSEKKTTVKHTCPKCGYVDETQATVEKEGLNFGSDPSSGLSGKCPWNKK